MSIKKIEAVKAFLSSFDVNNADNSEKSGTLDDALDCIAYLLNVSDVDEAVKANARTLIIDKKSSYEELSISRESLGVIARDFFADVSVDVLTKTSKEKIKKLSRLFSQVLLVKKSMNDGLSSKKAARYVTFYKTDGKSEGIANTVLSSPHINLYDFFVQKSGEAQDIKSAIASKAKTDSMLAMATIRKSSSENVKIVLLSQFFRCWLSWIASGDIAPLRGLLHDIETLKNVEADSVFLALVSLGFVGHSITENRQNLGVGGRGYGLVCDRPPVLDDVSSGWMQKHALRGFFEFSAKYAEISEIQIVQEGQHRGNLKGFPKVIHSAFWVDFVAVVLQEEKALLNAQESRKKLLSDLAKQAKRLLDFKIESVSNDADDILKLKAELEQERNKNALVLSDKDAEIKRANAEIKTLSNFIKSLKASYAESDALKLADEFKNVLAILEQKTKIAKKAKAK